MTVDKEGNNPTTLSVDEQIDEILLDMYCAGVGEGACYDANPAKCNYKIYDKSAKYNLKSLIRQVCEEVIGEDDVYDETSCYDSGHYSGRQDLRDEQRTKLNKILGSDE
jgi:hypothetical protein